MEVEVGQFDVGFKQAFDAVDHQLGRDVVVLEDGMGLQLRAAGFVEVSFDVFVSERNSFNVIS